jgi:Glycosyl transferase family 2
MHGTPPQTLSNSHANGSRSEPPVKPLVSLVVCGYNEAPIVEQNLATLGQYMDSLAEEYCWELIFINDGSTDNTGRLAEAFAQTRTNVRVLHHVTNFGLGQALQFAFNHCRGEYIVTYDLDLSYAPEHIGRLLRHMRDTKAKIVVTSPYATEGKVSNVPWLRRMLSLWANRFLSLVAQGHLSTLTGMVRAYDGRFVRSLNLKSMGMEINSETLYKAMVLRARIEEIPAHLDWGPQQKSAAASRQSSMQVLHHTLATLLAGFLFKPFMFFIIPGFFLFLVSCYANIWVCIHVLAHYGNNAQYHWFFDRLSAAIAAAYIQFPHAFIIGGISLMVAFQMLSLGILSLQSKSYFEEIFHLGTTIYRMNKEPRTRNKCELSGN